jgi:hypothetical protein
VTFTGTATAWEAVLDSSDSAYVQTSSSPNFVIDFTTVTMPAGSVIISARNYYNAQGVGAVNVNVARINNTAPLQALTSVQADYSNTVVGTMATQADIDGYQMVANQQFFGPQARFHEMSVGVVYVTPPVVAVSAPTGTKTTATTTATWTHTSDVDAPTGQVKYHVRAFTTAEYSVGGFDPLTSPASYDSGAVSSAATSASVGPLTSGAFRCYVRTAGTTAGADQWSAWAFSSFSVSLVPKVRTWNGTAFVAAPVKTWNGTAYVDAVGVKIWNGTAWVDAVSG